MSGNYTIHDFAEFMNDLNESDPETVKGYLSTGMAISEKTAKEHPHIQCADYSDVSTEYGVRLVGLINGFFEAEEERLAAIIEYPHLGEAASQEKKFEEYCKGNFEVDGFKIVEFD